MKDSVKLSKQAGLKSEGGGGGGGGGVLKNVHLTFSVSDT